MGSLSGKAAVVGVARTEGYRTPGRTSLQIHAEVARAALNDAGLDKSAVDGVLTAGCDKPTYTEDVAHSAVVCEYLGLTPRFTYSVDLGTPVFVKMLEIAADSIASNRCETVLLCCGEPTVSAASRRDAVDKMTAFGHPEFELPYGVSIPAFYALVAQRHMHEYGTTSKQLAEVALVMRRHASLNPSARFSEPLTIEDVLSSRMIAEPLRLLDCCITIEGGGALVMTSVERARDLPHRPVILLGSGQGFSHEHLVMAPSLTSFGSGSGDAAYRMAGMTSDEMDIAFLYDNFTINVLCQLEDLGFCPPGQSGPFVEAGHIELGGCLPVNPNGGLMSEGHPGRAGGLFHLIEAVEQLRGNAGKRQVVDAKTALVHGVGGVMSNHATAILAGD